MTDSTAQIPSLSGSYHIDPTHSYVGFIVRHAMVTKVHGAFTQVEGDAVIDADEPRRSHVSLRVDTTSLSTGVAARDAHLRTADFFDADAHPTLTFASTEVSRIGDTWSILGDLTIKGIARPVAIPFEHAGVSEDTYGKTRAGFTGSATISRQDWDLRFNSPLPSGGVLISDKVDLVVDISAVKVE